MSAEELKRFYKSKSKKPNFFSYDDDGNLVELNKEGNVIKTIALPDYRTPTYEEFDEMEKQRNDQIALANKEFEDARRELRNALSKPDALDSDILRINRKVQEADINLQAVRFPIQYVERESGVSINQIEFSKVNEKRKYPYDFYFLIERPYTLQDQYVRIGKAPVKPLVSVAEANALADASSGKIVILFAEPETNDYGFLSLKWAVQIEYNGTMYNSVHQAIAAEIAKSFNDQNNLQKIMMAESPDEVIYSLDNVPGGSELNEAKWNDLTKQLLYDINIIKFNQYPELAGRLLETKNAVLGAYLPNDNLIGIGLSLDNIQSQNPNNWTGQNLLGKALMNIRDKIRSDREIAQTQQIQQTAFVPLPRPRKKKVSIAPSTTVQETVPEAVPETVPEAVPEALPEVQVAPVGLPRPPRRRPKSIPEAAVIQSELQQQK